MKYTVVITFKNGEVKTVDAERISFWGGTGGIDLFGEHEIPFFPGVEEDVVSVTITFNRGQKP